MRAWSFFIFSGLSHPPFDFLLHFCGSILPAVVLSTNLPQNRVNRRERLMLHGYTHLLDSLFSPPQGTALDFEIGVDNRYYLVGNIKEADLLYHNSAGFDSWLEASRIAKSFGYVLAWEA